MTSHSLAQAGTLVRRELRQRCEPCQGRLFLILGLQHSDRIELGRHRGFVGEILSHQRPQATVRVAELTAYFALLGLRSSNAGVNGCSSCVVETETIDAFSETRETVEAITPWSGRGGWSQTKHNKQRQHGERHRQGLETF